MTSEMTELQSRVERIAVTLRDGREHFSADEMRDALTLLGIFDARWIKAELEIGDLRTERDHFKETLIDEVEECRRLRTRLEHLDELRNA